MTTCYCVKFVFWWGNSDFQKFMGVSFIEERQFQKFWGDLASGEVENSGRGNPRDAMTSVYYTLHGVFYGVNSENLIWLHCQCIR